MSKRATFYMPDSNRPIVESTDTGRKVRVNSVMFEVNEFMGKPYVQVYLYHTSNAWWMYTDRQFEKDTSKLISKMLKFPVKIEWTEQGMQKPRRASLEIKGKRANTNVYNWLVASGKLRNFTYTKNKS